MQFCVVISGLSFKKSVRSLFSMRTSELKAVEEVYIVCHSREGGPTPIKTPEHSYFIYILIFYITDGATNLYNTDRLRLVAMLVFAVWYLYGTHHRHVTCNNFHSFPHRQRLKDKLVFTISSLHK